MERENSRSERKKDGLVGGVVSQVPAYLQELLTNLAISGDLGGNSLRREERRHLLIADIMRRWVPGPALFCS